MRVLVRSRDGEVGNKVRRDRRIEGMVVEYCFSHYLWRRRQVAVRALVPFSFSCLL